MRRTLLFWLGILSCLPVLGQNLLKVSGTISSESDNGGVIASVRIKGTSRGMSSDLKGNYSLNDVPSNGILVFSAIGFKTVEIPVNSRAKIDVKLRVDDQTLNEVMVVAYGTAKKGTYTGAASVVKQSDIKDVPATSFENALIGRTPGIQITSSSGQAGSSPSIRIRGIGSMNASNEPLYVIDGVPVVSGNVSQLSESGYTRTTSNVMNSINPSDIESITILKDAAASSLYGSRAANGVIVITTKKGKSGKPVVNVKSSVGFTPSWATDNYETAGVQEQTNMLYRVFHDYNTSAGKTEAQANADALRRLNTKFNKHGYYFETTGTGLNENVTIKGMTDGIVNREGKYYDWEDALFRTGVYQTNDLSVSGGDHNTTYYSSLSYTKDNSRVKLNDFDRVSGRINLSQKVGKLVDFTSNVNIGRTMQSGYNDTRSTGSNYFYQERNLLWPFYWPTDYKTGKPFTERFGSLAQNAIYYDKQWDNSSETRRISANETVNIKFLPELNLRSVFSYDNAQVKDHLYYSALHFNGSATNGSVDEISTNINKIVSSTTLNYNKTFGLHTVGLLAGFEAERNKTDFQRSTGTNLASSTLQTVATAGKQTSNAYNWGNNLLSVLSRAEYNYAQKYFFSASYRRDGSSRLGPDTRWGDFWSVAGAWTISGEDFMKDQKYLSNLRLRASYGTNGTLPVSDFGWRSLITYDKKYMDNPGGTVSTISDPNLTWETSYSSNIALEFGLFNQRITGSVEYFNRNSKNLLQNVPISMVTGFDNTLRNIGEINNKGAEIEIGGDIIRKNDLRWSVSLNGAFIKSKVTKLYIPQGESSAQDIVWTDPTGGDTRAQYIYREGESTLAFWGYEWAGVDQTNGKNVWYLNKAGVPEEGDFLYNGRWASYRYSRADYTILGSALPDVYGGLNTDVEYKGISLAFNFNYKIGGKLYDGAFKDVADDGYYWERIRANEYYENMWTPEKGSGSLPKLDGNDLTDPQQYSSRQMYNASFFRLKNVTLAYNLPKKLVNRIGASNTRIYFNGTNLLTFSKYKNADPEVNQYGTRGWETPIGKTYTLGIELSF